MIKDANIIKEPRIICYSLRRISYPILLIYMQQVLFNYLAYNELINVGHRTDIIVISLWTCIGTSVNAYPCCTNQTKSVPTICVVGNETIINSTPPHQATFQTVHPTRKQCRTTIDVYSEVIKGVYTMYSFLKKIFTALCKINCSEKQKCISKQILWNNFMY